MKDYSSFIKDLSNLIACKSVFGVYDSPTKDHPFGEGVYSALNCFLEIGKRMGFETKNYDNYMGEISFGCGEEIGIIGHVDVVPAGNGWNTDPFVLTEKNGALYGRGVGDDKGPLLLCLYALNELKNSGAVFNKKIRLLIGCDEETGWRDVDYFSKVARFPDFGFSPDGNFPVVYAEKGITILTFHIPKLKNFDNLVGGTVVNAVCGLASITQTSPIDVELVKKFGLSLEDDGKIISVGVSCHGSTPEKGKNALKPLFSYLLACGERVEKVCKYLFEDGANLSKLGNEQGKVTLSPNVIKTTEKGIDIVCDCRIPAPLTSADITPYLDSFGIEYTAVEKHPPFMIDKNHPFVNALLNAYNSATGEKALPSSENGSTFARVFNKGCAFGAEFPDSTSTIHQPNENMKISDVLRCYEIYKGAIANLIK